MKKYWRTIILIIVILILLFVGVALGVQYYRNYLANQDIDIPAELDLIYPQASEGDLQIVYEGQVMDPDIGAKKVGDVFFLSYDFVKGYLINDLYYDEAEKVITYTTHEDVMRFKTNDLNYTVNDQPLQLEIGITSFEESQMPYLPLTLVRKLGHHQFTYNQGYQTLIVDDLYTEEEEGIVDKPQWDEKEQEDKGDLDDLRMYLRLAPSEDSPYIREIMAGMAVHLVGEEGDFYKVLTKEGFIGYLLKDYISSINLIYKDQKTMGHYSVFPSKHLAHEVVLGWHMVTNMTANQYVEGVVQDTKKMNVISPTWFHVKEEDGSISSLADLDYVRYAHDRDIQVWALFSNSFDRQLTHEVLKSTAKRDHMIKQLLAYAKLYELDGINVDFENVGSEDGENYVQFIKELSVYLKQAGLTVSVDMYVPRPWTAHYGREEIGPYIDYLIIMGYDEHWSTSPKAGSVASIGFVDDGIRDTLDLVPPEKVILGIPFYTRLWKEVEEGGEIIVSSGAYGMDAGREQIESAGGEFRWDDETAQYYGEYTLGDARYRMWLEEERSIGEKISLAKDYGLAGIAGWQLGLENDGTWDVIEEYTEK